MSDRSKAAADRIREQVPILQVLSTYGYRVRDDGGYREQQFSCDLHGTGRDNKPSARVYPESNSWFCFACGQTRDAIETVKAKEGCGFWEAVKILEQAYGLEPLPVDYVRGIPEVQNLVSSALDSTRTFAQDAADMCRFLDSRTSDRDLPLDMLLRYWEAYDRVSYQVQEGLWVEKQGREALKELMGRMNAATADLQEHKG